jgi:hypothetical protein
MLGTQRESFPLMLLNYGMHLGLQGQLLSGLGRFASNV